MLAELLQELALAAAEAMGLTASGDQDPKT